MSAPNAKGAKPRVKIKLPRKGEKRQWVKCRTCGAVAYYDYVPYSLSNPIMILACGHSHPGSRDLGADRIGEDQAMPVYIEQMARRAIAQAAGVAA